MMTPYMLQRQKMKTGQKKTDQEQRAEDREKEGGGSSIAKKSAKKKAEEKEAAKADGMTLKQFFDTMCECAPEKCMETGERLIFKITPVEVICHILPKRSITNGGVPSQAKNPLNIVYLNIDPHTKMDKDMGTKSAGKYVKSMKIFPLLKERVAQMWKSIPKEERKNVPEFLKPE